MITVVKQDPMGAEKIHYQGELVERLADRVVIQAEWMHSTKELGYTRFEPGDHFTEYYYTDRWFNIFDIAAADGRRKGWYCNVAQPAVIFEDHIEQIDLLLDVWVKPDGEPLILDEDEFTADTTLSEEQREGARAGLQALLQLLATRQEAFSSLASY
jgi:predicted RNA-binding protein associated with RNAse of E/G family